MSSKTQPCEECAPDITNLRERVVKMETVVGMEDADDGMRGDIKWMKKALRGMEKRGYIAFGIGMAIYWWAEHYFK